MHTMSIIMVVFGVFATRIEELIAECLSATHLTQLYSQIAFVCILACHAFIIIAWTVYI